MSMDNEGLAHEYGQRLAMWQEFASRLQPLLLEDLKDLRPTITGRVKSLRSALEKFQRRGGFSIDDITDWVGFRVVVSSPTDLMTAHERIISTYGIREAPLSTGGAIHSALHFNLGIDAVRAGLPEWQHLRHVRAEVQLLTAHAAAIQEIEHHQTYKGRPPTAASAIAEMRQCIADFEKLLDRPDIDEKQHLHPYFQKNRFLLHPNPEEIFSEVPIGLGTQFRMDFLLLLADGSYTLVEIESPKHRLFTKHGEFGAPVNHAVRQVEDWQDWIEANLSVVEKKYPGIISPLGQVIIGRSRGLDEPQLRQLRRRNINMRGRLVISTYDDLIAQARSFVAGLAQMMGTQ